MPKCEHAISDPTMLTVQINMLIREIQMNALLFQLLW